MSHEADRQARSIVAAGMTLDGLRRAFQACDVCWQAHRDDGRHFDELRCELLHPERLDDVEPGKLPYIAVYHGPAFVCLFCPGDALSSMVAKLAAALGELAADAAPAAAQDPADGDRPRLDFSDN